MGMDLMNPPTVEGWHTGREWIDSGTLVERINYATDLLGNTELPGVKSLINRLMARGETLSPEAFVDGCLDVLGPLNIDEATRSELIAHSEKGGELRSADQTAFTPPQRGNVPDDRINSGVPVRVIKSAEDLTWFPLVKTRS